MPRHNYRDEPEDSPASSSEDYRDRLPRKPRPAVTKSSSYDSKRSTGRHINEDGNRHERRQTRPNPDGRFDDRRRRRPRDPERERRRQERASRDPDYAARREERRAARRAERRASQPVQSTRARSAAAAIDRVNGDDSDSHNEQDPTGVPDAPRSPASSCAGAPPPYVAERGESYQAHVDDRERHKSSRRHKSRPSRRESRGQSSRRRYTARDDWDLDIESTSSFDEKKRPGSSSTSTYSELQWYKKGIIEDGRHYYRDDGRRGCCGFSRRCTCIGTILAVIVLIIIIVVAAVVSKRNQFSYHVSTAQVNETAAFTSGAATRDSVNNTQDGIGAGTDIYVLHQGNATKFLADIPTSQWVSFEDMWSNNLDTMQNSCGILNYGDNDSPEELANIYNAIQDRANASLVDHRLILAFILQESKGCVRVPNTKSSGGVRNTGLMQSHNGHTYTSKHSAKSILSMVQDGTQGTKKGNGLVQELNAYYGNPYAAARAYNSGYIPASGELTEAAGATKCYVSDIANRLTGWVKAESTCSD